jgi:PKD repeat protein
VSPGTTLTFTQIVTAPAGNDAFTATLKVTGLPSGWSVLAFPPVLTFTAGPNAQSWTITIQVPAGTGSGSYSFNVKADPPQGSGVGEGSGTNVKVNVSAPTPTPTPTPVPNQAPAVTAPDDQTANEGEEKTFNLGSFTDDSLGPWQITVDWGDGSAESFSTSATGDIPSRSHTYDDNGVYTLTVTVTDNEGASGSASFSITVNNVPPTVSIVPPDGTVDCRKEARLTFSFSDPGVNDSPWRVEIDWGDGSTDSPSFNTQVTQTVTHAYTLPGTYTVTVKVTDKDGGVGEANGSITVEQVYAVDFLPPFDDSSPSGLIVNTMKNGRVVPVKATIFDVCRESYVNDPTTEVTIKVSKTSGSGTPDPVEEYADAGQSSAGTNRFRWTTDSSVPGGGFWIYNLDSKALGLVVNNLYRVDIYVGPNWATLATRDTWAVLQPVK